MIEEACSTAVRAAAMVSRSISPVSATTFTPSPCGIVAVHRSPGAHRGRNLVDLNVIVHVLKYEAIHRRRSAPELLVCRHTALYRQPSSDEFDAACNGLAVIRGDDAAEGVRHR